MNDSVERIGPGGGLCPPGLARALRFVVLWHDVGDRFNAATLWRSPKRPARNNFDHVPHRRVFGQIIAPLSPSGAPLLGKRNVQPWATTHGTLALSRDVRTVRVDAAYVLDNRNSCPLAEWSSDSTCP